MGYTFSSVAETFLQVDIPNRSLFKAAEVCDLVKLQPYVLRSWEAEFPKLGVSNAGGARVSFAEIAAIFEASGLPKNPLSGVFPSIGCMPCTQRVRPGEPPRAGRWRGTGRTECGIHGAAPV